MISVDAIAPPWSYATKISGSFARNTGLSSLLLELQRSFFSRESDLSPRHRRRYVQALHYLCEYLEGEDAPHCVVEELQELCTALLDLDRGIVRPFLQPSVPEKGRRPDASDVWLVRAQFATAVGIMISNGTPEVSAFAKAEKELGFLRPLLAPTAETLSSAAEGWRRKLEEGSCKDARAQRFYNLHPLPSPDKCIETVRQLFRQTIEAALALDDSRLTESQKAGIHRMASRSLGKI